MIKHICPGKKKSRGSEIRLSNSIDENRPAMGKSMTEEVGSNGGHRADCVKKSRRNLLRRNFRKKSSLSLVPAAAITRWEHSSNLRSLMISVAATESQEINLAGKKELHEIWKEKPLKSGMYQLWGYF